LTEINNAIAPAVGQLGGLDVLIVNAGTSHIPDFQETADEAYDALMGVNPKGECFSMFHVLPNAERMSPHRTCRFCGRSQRKDPLHAASKGPIRGEPLPFRTVLQKNMINSATCRHC